MSGVGLEQSQSLTAEQRLEAIEEQIERFDQVQDQVLHLSADIELCINYMQAIAQTILGAEKLAELNARIEKRKAERKNARLR